MSCSLFVLLAVAAVIGGANAKPPSRIRGGQVAGDEEFSAAITLTSSWSPIITCGGAIIGPRHILTAAHCVNKEGNINKAVRAGFRNYKDTSKVVERSISKIILYEGPIPEVTGEQPAEGDFAILVLNKALPIEGAIQKIALPTHQPEAGVTYFVGGWGSTVPDYTNTEYQINTLAMTLRDPSTCRKDGFLPNVICAHSNIGATCSGDSGSPLVRGGVLYGIVSAGECLIGEPSGFVNVYDYLNWINVKISQNP